MGMMKTRKPKRYAAGGMMDTSNFPRVANMPSTGYMAGRDPEHIYFQRNQNLAAQGTAPAATDLTIGDFTSAVGGGGGDSGGGAGGDSSSSSSASADAAADAAAAPSGDGGSGAADFRRGGAVKAKKMAKGGMVKAKMGRGDGCAMRGKTRGTMR